MQKMQEQPHPYPDKVILGSDREYLRIRRCIISIHPKGSRLVIVATFHFIKDRLEYFLLALIMLIQGWRFNPYRISNLSYKNISIALLRKERKRRIKYFLFRSHQHISFS